MTAAQKIKTPVMVLPPLPGSRQPAADMRALATRLRRLSLADVLAGVTATSACMLGLPQRSKIAVCADGRVWLQPILGMQRLNQSDKHKHEAHLMIVTL